jgi:hypothetical protein
MVATPFTTEAAPAFGAPVSGLPFSVNVTVPRFGVGVLDTVAVKLTAAPRAACGLADDVTVVVVECPIAGVMLRHQPAVADAGTPDPSALWRNRLHAPWASAPAKAVSNVELPAGAA